MKKLKVLSIILLLAMLFNSFPISAFADALENERQDEQQLREELAKAADIAENPKGLFEFLTTRMNTSENLSSVEFAVVRKGGTADCASVTFKAIDVTAKYGEDYTISVPEGLYKNTLPGNADAKPLMQSIALNDEEQVISADDENTVDEEASETAETEICENYEELSPPEESIEPKATGLRAARDMFTGKTSQRKDWREADREQKENALDLHKEMYDGVPGVTCTLEFADGEYMKMLKFNTIDDKFSEDEEQVIFALLNPEGAVLGESVNAFMNIEDNEEKEKVEFEILEDQTVADTVTGYAEVTVQRTAGLQRYGLISVGTAAVSAQPEVDYTPIMTELRFVPGQESQKVRVPLLGGSGDGLQFLIKLDADSPNLSESGKTQALVTIKAPVKTEKSGAAENGGISPQVNLMSSEAMDGRYWTTTLRQYDRAGGFGIVDENGWAYLGIKGIKSKEHYMTFNADLSMVEKIVFDWSNPCEGTWYHPWYWVKGAWYKTFYSRMKIGNNIRVDRGNDFFGSYNHEYVLNDDDRTQNTITFINGTYGNCANSELNVGDVKLYYKPINVMLKDIRDDIDATITPETWTATNQKTDAMPIYIGKLAFTNDSAAAVKSFYAGDTVYLKAHFDPQFSDTSKVYLWGYKIERKGGLAGGGYYYVKGDSLNIRDIYTGALKDYEGRFIPKNEVMLGNNDTVVLLPVYKARTAFVKINFDTEKGGMLNNSFQNGDLLKIGMLDTVKLNAYAKTGSFVTGYDHGDINDKDKVVTTSEDERILCDADIDYANTVIVNEVNRKTLRPINGMEINSALPGELDFHPQKTFSNLTVQYSVPELKVRVNPKSGNKDMGKVAYIAKEGEGESQEGNSQKPMIITPIEQNKSYTISGMPDNGYRMLWKDWSGDTNEDGKIDANENNKIKKYETLFDRHAIYGNFYNYVVSYDKPLIYYSFEPKPNGGVKGEISGKVYLKGGDILSNTKRTAADTELKPLSNISVTVNGHNLVTDEEGGFSIEHEDFQTNEYHSLIINYNGRSYTGYANVDCFTDIYIEEYDSFIPYNFEAFEGNEKLDFRTITNKDAKYKFTFDIKTVKPGISAEKALIRIYSKEGLQRGIPLEVTPEGGSFSFEFNPAASNVIPGDTMTVQLVDQNGLHYLEHDVGFYFQKYLSTFSLLTSFKSPASGVIDMVGTIDATFDLGLAGKADEKIDKKSVKDQWIIAFGFEKNWEKSLYDNTPVDDGNAEAKPAEEKLKDAAKSSDGEKTKKTVEESVDKNNKEKKSAKVTADMKFGLSTSLYLRMTVNTDKTSPQYGDAYFNEMILSATVSGNFNTKVEVQTPIGVTVFVALELGGEITASMVIEQYDNKKFYFNDEGEIDFSRAGTTDPRRDFTIYGKFVVKPYILITVGASIPLAEFSVTGKAQFTMNFTTTGSGSGNVKLTCEMALKVLFFDFNWQIAEKTWDLFSYGELMGFNPNALFADDNYLYDSAESYQVLSRDYLNNRGQWQGSTENSLMRLFGDENNFGNEQVLQTGVYPYPYTLLAPIGENRQLLVFLDDDTNCDDRNRTQVYYSINNGTSWSAPQKIDTDNTPDSIPSVYDMGDRVLVSWSSASAYVTEDDSTMKVLNNRCIKARFFDKATQTFGDVQQVTQKTDDDTYSDTAPYIAYWKTAAGEENLMIVYTKTEYKETSGDSDKDAVVGDIINAYSALAYRFYDFDKGTWGVEDGINGQGFIDASEYVDIDESNLLIKDGTWAGYWSRIPNESEISIKSWANNDPVIADSNAIGYGDYAVLAYSLDVDGNLTTENDRELFIQLYSFTEKIFYPAMRCTYDDNSQTNLMFAQSDGNVYLYYISGGDICSIDVGQLFNENMIYYTIDNKVVFVLNKSADAYRKPEVVVRHSYDIKTDELGRQTRENEKPIDEFMVKADKNNVYILWGENSITYKDGINPNSDEASSPENYYREHHIFAARQTIGDEVLTHVIKEDGTQMYYPENDPDGNPIDYKTIYDVNNDLGKVKAGDPVIKISRTKQWSEPVQLTDEKGANFNDIDFDILSDGSIRVVFVKGMSEIMNVAGEQMPAENVNNRTLMTADFYVGAQKTEALIEPIGMPKPMEIRPVGIKLNNKALDTLDDISVEVYQGSELISEYTEMQLRGGEEKNISLLWQAPENLSDVSLQVLVKKDGITLCSAEQQIAAASVIDVSDVTAEFEGRNKLKITGTAINNGNIAAADAKVSSKVSGVETGAVMLGAVDAGESKQFEFYADIRDDMFESAAYDDGSITAVLKLSVNSSGIGQYLECIRCASKQDIDIINNIKTFGLKANDSEISEILTLKKGNSIDIEPQITYAGKAVPEPRLVFVSSNEDVADFSEGYLTLSGKKAGTAAISAYIIPPKSALVMSQNSMAQVDNFATLPKEAVMVQNFAVNVTESSGDGSSAGIPDSSKTEVDTDKNIVTIVGEGNTITIDRKTLNSSAESMVSTEISLPGGRMLIPADIIKEIASQSTGDISVSITRTNGEDGRPIVDVAIKSNGKNITDFGGKRITLLVPYTLKDGEDENAVVIYYVGEDGQHSMMANSVYKDGMVAFRTDHLSKFAVDYNNISFEDVTGWAKEYVSYLAARNVVNGVEDSKFMPGKLVTRAEFVKMLALLSGDEIKPVTDSRFKDVDTNSWYAPYVSWASEKEYVLGVSDITFGPDDKITREQIAVMIQRFADKEEYGLTSKNKGKVFADSADISGYAKDAVTFLSTTGIISGRDNNLFSPKDNATRAESAKMLAVLLNTGLEAETAL